MKVVCPNCKASVEYESVRPNFCATCGTSLPATIPSDAMVAETIVVDEDPRSKEGQDASANERIDGYRLEEQLGQGGMGVVWKAVEEDSGRPVALKLLSTNLSHDEVHTDRFLREAQLAASLSHPRSTFVFGAGRHLDNPYIVMELMPGDTLQHVVEREGPLSVERSVDAILDVIDGLTAAHDKGVVHRDVKPSNCFVDTDQRIKVGDFGLSKSIDAASDLTKTGTFIGTPLYAAPEQIRGEGVDERTDIYAVGATLFYLLTGEGPFDGDAVSVIAQIAAEPPRHIKDLRPELPDGLDKIIARTLEKQPDRRFTDMQSLRKALQPYATGGLPSGSIWLRLAAYFIDVTLFRIISGVFSAALQTTILLFTVIRYRLSQDEVLDIAQSNWMLYIAPVFQLLLTAALYGACERRWGAGPGKWLFGLRLTNMQGERASSWQVFVRTFFFPIGFGLPLLGVIATQRIQALDVETLTRGLLFQIWFLTSLPTFVPLLAFVTMRRSTRYRAAHDLLTGTQVVRVNSGVFRKKTKQAYQHQLVAADEMPTSFGPFEVIGCLGQTDSYQVLIGRDQVLERHVWIHVSPISKASPSTMPHAFRAARPQWLQGGQLGEWRWDAFEAIDGAPLTQVVAAHRKAKNYRPIRWLQQLVNELQESLNDDSVPSAISLDTIWIDANENVRLLNEPIELGSSDPSTEDADHQPTDTSNRDATERAHALVSLAIENCLEEELSSPSVNSFIAEFQQRSQDRDTLEWASEQLADLVHRPRRVTWDSRIASLAISIGFENSIYSVLGMTLIMLVGGLIPIPTAVLGVITFALLMGIAIFLAVKLNGGLAFHLLKMAIVKRNGAPASKFLMGLRAFISWFGPIISFVGLWVFVTIAIESTQSFRIDLDDISQSSRVSTVPPANITFRDDADSNANEEADSTTDEETDSAESRLRAEKRQQLRRALIFGALILVGIALLTIIGIVYSLVRPRRGLQDLICGTMLVPK